MTILYYVVKIHIKSKPRCFLINFLITIPAFLLTQNDNTLIFKYIKVHSIFNPKIRNTLHLKYKIVC